MGNEKRSNFSGRQLNLFFDLFTTGVDFHYFSSVFEMKIACQTVLDALL